MEKIKGYKGFDKDLKCRGFQYEIGKEYEEQEVKVCEKGFLFCENPLDVLRFYPPFTENGINRFCEVEGSGNFDKDENKIACTNIKIIREINLYELIEAGVKYILSKTDLDNNKATNTGVRSAATNTDHCSAAINKGNCSVATNTGYYSAATNTGDRSIATNTGYYSAATNTGYCSVATNTGYYSAATNTGYCSVATNTGNYSAATNTGDCSVATNTGHCSAAINKGNCSVATNMGGYSVAMVKGEESIAVVTGKDSKAMGEKGCWLVLTERETKGDKSIIKDIKAFKVDGKKVKANVFYQLINGKLVEVE